MPAAWKRCMLLTTVALSWNDVCLGMAGPMTRCSSLEMVGGLRARARCAARQSRCPLKSPSVLLLRGGNGALDAPSVNEDPAHRTTIPTMDIHTTKGTRMEAVGDYLLVAVYFFLFPVWFVALYGFFWIHAATVSSPTFSAVGRFYLNMSTWCLFLTPPAFIVTVAGMERGHNSWWLKSLPLCVFSLSMFIISGHFGAYNLAPPKVVATVVASCLGTLLLPGKKGMVFGGSLLCCAMYYDCLFKTVWISML